MAKTSKKAVWRFGIDKKIDARKFSIEGLYKVWFINVRFDFIEFCLGESANGNEKGKGSAKKH
ncbi:MAG: hypothetical protein ACJAUH_002432 [Saprospiraceae bacterium]